MRASKIATFWCIAATCTLGIVRPQSVGTSQPRAVVKAGLTDFQWLSGHWEGQVDGNPIEEFCSNADRGVMMCMFRVMDAQKNLGLEFITLQNKLDSVEERVRFFSPDLGERESAKTLVLRVTRFAPTESVFENPNGSSPSRVTLTRNGPDAMTSRIELLDEKGKPALIEAHWKRSH